TPAAARRARATAAARARSPPAPAGQPSPTTFPGSPWGPPSHGRASLTAAPRRDHISTMGLRRTVALLVVPALGLGLAACDAEPESSPEEVAGLVARAIADGDFTAVPLVEGSAQDAARARQTAYEGLGDLPVTAEVVEVRELEEVPRAEARLAITWDLPGDDDPVREVSLRLRRVEDEW